MTTGDGSDSEQKSGYITVLPRPGDDAPIAFEDDNLEAAVRQALGVSGSADTVGDARRATALQIVDVTVANLEGLQYFTGLEVLRVSGGYDDQTALDLAPLASLSNLRELYLNGAGIIDLTPLEELTGLEVLHVYRNFIHDVGPLSDLNALRTLYLYNNEISDLSPLSQLTNLVDLNLFGNVVQDASHLAGLINLRTLYLDNNQVSNIGFMANLVALESLYIGMNAIADVSPLANLDSLVALGLNDNMITAIDPLAGLTNLSALFIEGNPLTAAAACPTVEVLADNGTEVTADIDCAKVYTLRAKPVRQQNCLFRRTTYCV